MKKVIVFGSGGLAKELLGYLEDSGGYDVICVVSTEPFNNAAYANNYDVRSAVPRGTQAWYLLAVADPGLKRKFVSENADRWTSYVHPSCHVSRYAKLGKGCLMAPYSSICGDGIIGDFVTLNVYAEVAHDCVIHDYVTFSPYAETCGNCEVGEDVFLGCDAKVLPKVKIAAGAKVSAGAVVRKSILEAVTVYGDPAKQKEVACR